MQGTLITGIVSVVVFIAICMYKPGKSLFE